MNRVIVATIEGKPNLHFLGSIWKPGQGSVWDWREQFKFAHEFKDIHDAAEAIDALGGKSSILSLRIELADRIKAEIEASGNIKFNYIIKRTSVHNGAEIIENTDFEKFVFVHASMAEHIMFTDVNSLKKEGFVESYRNQSEDGTYVAATHVFKNHEQIKFSIERVEVVEKK